MDELSWWWWRANAWLFAGIAVGTPVSESPLMLKVKLLLRLVYVPFRVRNDYNLISVSLYGSGLCVKGMGSSGSCPCCSSSFGLIRRVSNFSFNICNYFVVYEILPGGSILVLASS